MNAYSKSIMEIIQIVQINIAKFPQSSQLDLLPKSEMFDGLAIYCDAEGV